MQAKGEQLKMFMTPSEIHAGWQPLDADREVESEGEARTYSGSEPWTKGSGYHEVFRAPHTGAKPRADWLLRSQGGTSFHDRPESDEELWNRKTEEAYSYGRRTDSPEEVRSIGGQSSRWTGGSMHEHKMTGTEDLTSAQFQERHWAQRNQQRRADAGLSHTEHPTYHTQGSESYVERVPGVTLGESIEAEGVHSPVRLGRTIGSMGKPEIVGGHHRLAVATHLAAVRSSEQFLPVLHHESIQEARSEPPQGAYKYT